MMRLTRLLLDSGASFFSGGGGLPAPASQAAPAPVAAPAPSPAPAPQPAAGSPERGTVNSSATNAGERSFDLPENYGQPQPQGGQPSQQRPALPTPTDPNQAAGAGAPAAAPANFQSIRDAAREYGYDFGQDVTDDRMALQKLIAQANANRQADYYAQVGQRLVPHAQQFQEYLAAKNQPQQPEGRKPWEAPPFDQRWASMVTQDPQTGIYLSKPGVPSEIGKAVNEYADWKQKFDENPASVINDMVKVRAREEAMAIYQEQNAIQQQQQAAQSIVNQNASWFYAQDQSGRRIMDQSGRPTPTPAGAAYLRHLGTVRSAGVTNPVQQDALARQLLAGEYAAMNVQRTTQQQQAAGFPAQQQIQQTNTNPLQALPPQQRAITQGATEPGQEGLSLFERLQKNFQAGGITDAAFLPENMGF